MQIEVQPEHHTECANHLKKHRCQKICNEEGLKDPLKFYQLGIPNQQTLLQTVVPSSHLQYCFSNVC